MESNSFKYLIYQVFAISVAGMIIYSAFDLLLCVFITHSKFIYTASDYIIKPTMFGIIMGLVLFSLERNKR